MLYLTNQLSDSYQIYTRIFWRFVLTKNNIDFFIVTTCDNLWTFQPACYGRIHLNSNIFVDEDLRHPWEKLWWDRVYFLRRKIRKIKKEIFKIGFLGTTNFWFCIYNLSLSKTFKHHIKRSWWDHAYFWRKQIRNMKKKLVEIRFFDTTNFW
jgi:hypothetical protein